MLYVFPIEDHVYQSKEGRCHMFFLSAWNVKSKVSLLSLEMKCIPIANGKVMYAACGTGVLVS